MTLLAGVDVGNASTEIVLVEADGEAPTLIAFDRRPTRGDKGSERSALAAARLLERMEARIGRRADQVLLTPQTSVRTTVEETSHVIPRPEQSGGLRVLTTAGCPTPSGCGVGVGRPLCVGSPVVVGEPVILVAEDPLGYRETSIAIRRWLRAGASVQGVLLAGDEARLVAGRIEAPDLPIVDSVDARMALSATQVALEVGDGLLSLADPVWLAHTFGVSSTQARCLTRQVAGASVAVILAGTPKQREPTPPEPVPAPVADRWLVDLNSPTLPSLRPGALRRDRLCSATLDRQRAEPPHSACYANREVYLAGSESEAGSAGALSTPGATKSAVVVDLGGGTLDLLQPGQPARTVAGCGELLTLATASVLDISLGAAEWVKRTASARVESPHLSLDEHGRRNFLPQPAPPGCVGWLTAPGPNGPFPFSTNLAPAEWRLARRALKQLALVDNLTRAAGSDGLAEMVLLVGGAAEDDELLDLAAAAHPHTTFGRGRVAGSDVANPLGTRWAVAYGLTLLHARGLTRHLDPDEVTPTTG